ncbi:MAG: hypothetical protein ACTSUE_13545 [Promethearchaeota archaeon]
MRIPVKTLTRAVPNSGIGPLSGGLWNRVAYIPGHDILVTSSPNKYAGGGTSFYEKRGDGLFGSPRWFNKIPDLRVEDPFQAGYIPGGALVYWPGHGILTYESAFRSGMMTPLDENGHPLVSRVDGDGDKVLAAYPVFDGMGLKADLGNVTSITIGDVTGNGFLDVVLSGSDWGKSGYHPDGKRWNHPEFRPYEWRHPGEAGNDPTRDEGAPYWGAKTLSRYLPETRFDGEGCVRASCKSIWGGFGSKFELCTNLPLKGPFEFSRERRYRGKSPVGDIVVLEGKGEPRNIEEDEPAFEYAGQLKTEDGTFIQTFGQAGIAVLPGGDLITVDFVGQVQYFHKIDRLVYEEKPVLIESGYVPTLFGPIGTVSIAGVLSPDGSVPLVFSGENGLVCFSKAKISPEGLKLASPEANLAFSSSDAFKEDILAVPSFLDSEKVLLGSGAGTYSLARWSTGKELKHDGLFNNLRVVAGPVGSVQGTTEEKWGYTCPTAFDWNGDGSRLVVSGDISEYMWLLDASGKRRVLRDLDGAPVRVAWRVRPAVFELDGEVWIVTLDQKDRMTLFQKAGEKLRFHSHLLAGNGEVLQFGRYGGSKGRLKLEAIMNRDANQSLPDLLVGTCGLSVAGKVTGNAMVLKFLSSGSPGEWLIDDNIMAMAARDPAASSSDSWGVITFGHHSVAPATIPEEWDGRHPKSGTGLLMGAENGRFYYFGSPVFKEYADLF